MCIIMYLFVYVCLYASDMGFFYEYCDNVCMYFDFD